MTATGSGVQAGQQTPAPPAAGSQRSFLTSSCLTLPPHHITLLGFSTSAPGGKDEMNDPLENKQANKNPTGTTIGEG